MDKDPDKELDEEIEDRAALDRLLMPEETSGPGPAREPRFCGLFGDEQTLEDRLMSYARGETTGEQDRLLDDHVEGCAYCVHRLTAIRRVLDEVEAEEGFSREQVARLLEEREHRFRETSLTPADRVRWLLEGARTLLSPAWKPATAGALALLLLVVTYQMVHEPGEGPLAGIVTSRRLQRLPESVGPSQLAAAMAGYDGLFATDHDYIPSHRMETEQGSGMRALLPETWNRGPARSLLLGYVLQTLRTLAEVPRPEAELRRVQEELWADAVRLLGSMPGGGPLREEAELVRERAKSDLYSAEAIRSSVDALIDRTRDATASTQTESGDVGRILDYGAWLSLLSRDLGLQAQGVDRRGALEALLDPRLLQGFGALVSSDFPEAFRSEAAAPLEGIARLGARAGEGAVEQGEARAFQEHVTDLVDLAFQWLQ